MWDRDNYPSRLKISLSFGSQSENGIQLVARMLTFNSSLKTQGRSVLDFLTGSCSSLELNLHL
jgi:hypothetical protein